MSSHNKPICLQHNCVASRILEQKIWRPCNKNNQHFMAAIVGREGSGKSHTALRIAESVDPSFNADRVMFEPQAFLEKLQEWKAAGETKGKMVVADEAGVGLGVRTWYSQDQILFNQVLQVIRDENMGIIFTLPRLNELDSQARGRLHAFIEMAELHAGEYAKVRWLNWDPTRDERDDVYRQYPKLRINGRKQQVKHLKFGPPSQTLVSAYSERKDSFQDELYQDAIDEMDDSEHAELSAQDIADEIISDGVEQYIYEINNGAQRVLDKDTIGSEYDLGQRQAKRVKKLVKQQSDISDVI